ncbi:MAG: Crp/Fnr family transcriptional regulator [Bdellovibrionales bacterium]|nr:Crp/Fnr family transcriptional regulator [Bdellovibrionales bacterium]
MIGLPKLRLIDLFRELDDEELTALSAVLSEKKVKKNAPIIQASDSTDTIMFLLDGKVRVSLTGDDGREVVLTHIERGGYFGEIALLTGHDRSADVTALSDSTLFVLRRDDFYKHNESYTGFTLALLRELAIRLRETSIRVGDLALLDVYRRVAITLKRLGDEVRQETRSVWVIDKRPTHQELAAMVGTSREMVTRALKSLEEDECIRVDGKKIELIRLPK